MNALEPSRSSNLVILYGHACLWHQGTARPWQWADTLKNKTHPRSRIRPDRVNVAKRLDEPEQNYTDEMVRDWSKLLTLKSAVVCRAQAD